MILLSKTDLLWLSRNVCEFLWGLSGGCYPTLVIFSSSATTVPMLSSSDSPAPVLK